jgi:hypothetical protein
MCRGKSGFLAVLTAVVAAGADDPRAVTVEVGAGAHERRDTPVVFPLPASLRRDRTFTLESLDDHKAVPVQATSGESPEVVWIEHGPLPAGAKRRYRLAPAPSGEPAKGAPAVSFRVTPEVLSLELDGRRVLDYHVAVAEPPRGIDPVYRRSGFIHPLTTRSGIVVTEDFPPEHAHQHGVFFAWVNTTYDGRHVDFWNQRERTGRVGRDPSRPGPDFVNGPVFGEFRDALHHDDLTAPGGPEPVLTEAWVVRAYNIPGVVVLDFESRQTCAGSKPLTLNQYHYGGMGVRGNGRWFDRTARGNAPPDPARSGRSDFLTSEGKHRPDGNHTRPRWVDLSGEVDGRVGGVTVLDHPGNFRFPQPVRLHPNMPYFCFAPTVLGAFEIAPGRPYTSRYRIVTHDGPPDPAATERLWNDLADPPQVRTVTEHP